MQTLYMIIMSCFINLLYVVFFETIVAFGFIETLWRSVPQALRTLHSSSLSTFWFVL